jgi:putative ABC transport system permease protein
MSYDPQQKPAPQARRAASWRRYLQFWGARVDSDVDDEIHFHLDMLVSDLISRGMSEPDARAAAARRFGDLPGARTACVTIGNRRQRRMTRARTLDALRQDAAFALRTLGRQKAWTAIAVLTLALGIGATTAVFSVVNTVVLRPLPFAHADRLVLLWRSDPTSKMMVSADDDVISAWAGAHSLEAVQRYGQGELTLTGSGEPAVVVASWIDRDLPQFAGIPLLRGRTFTSEEAADSGSRVVLISEGLWRERYGGSNDVLGKTMALDGRPYTIIGVTSSKLRVPGVLQNGPTQVWLPRPPKSTLMAHLSMARLRPGVTIEQAEQELAEITKRVPSAQHATSRKFVPKLLPPGRFNGWGDSLSLLSISVAVLLLIACANVAHLLIARGATREREMAIRRALGASGARIARQLLTESVILAAAGCAAGLGVAKLGLEAFVAMRPPRLEQLGYTTLDGRVLGTALVIAAATGIIFGLIGAMHTARHGTAESLKGTALSGTAAPRAYRLRSTLVVTEMALSAMLLVGAVLLVRSVINLQHVEPGFDTENLYSMSFRIAQRVSPSEAETKRLAIEALDGARRIPGVKSATIAASAPPEASYMIGELQVEHGTTPKDAASFNAINEVRPDYFSVLGIPIIAGHGFESGSEKRGDVVINEGMARKLWPGTSAVGRHFRFAPPPGMPDKGEWNTVVGVTADAVVRGLSEDRGAPFVYMPSETGTSFTGFTLVVRMASGVDAAQALRRLSLSIAPSLAPPPVTSIEHAFAASISTQRFTMAVLSIFAIVAVLLAAIGLYGVISYMVTQRTREIGIRIALGATAREVARVVALRGLVLSVIGLSIGLTASVWGTRVVQKTLYGVGATDPMSFGAGAVLLLAVSVIACVVPTRRAMRVDPIIAMRAE